ncbi:phosphate regulon sensor histidine kinase PhoR [Ideonella livida]|uniref:Phosphate regulon sensor protein PhoR n=1 Tax=Ideonella livida TaxID=2707176 RepID=A0A7C9TGE7_9BURK|nr:phosphate regulon sensor histidine kinase PhoR [Ideonella livida]NDY89598.1 phosphate regulon sensor histidine kinase PhoR [Ideonella livida]
MFWIFSRLLSVTVACSLGALAGFFLGRWAGLTLVGALVGVALPLGLLVGLDAWRGYLVLRWISREPQGSAPLESGFWGGVALRTERVLRQQDQEIRKAQSHLAHFLRAIEASPNGVLLIDAQEQITWCSLVAAEHLNLDRERDRLQRITNLVRAPTFVQALHEGATEQVVTFQRPGQPGLLQVTLRAFGEGERLLLTQDITERERNEAMRRDFVANVSHEIRTPLTVLSGFVETMVNLPLSDAERGRVLSLMTQQTQRMQALVGDLLALARLEGSPRPPSDHWLALARLGEAVQAEAQGLSAGRHVLHFDWGEDLEVAGNEAELQSAIVNLVNNAVRYTPAGGEISVSAQRRPEGGLWVAVRDTGPGIAPEHLPRLTERFYRVDSSRSRETGGTGLGLSIVKHVVQRHGGELVVRSELGKGSEFKLLLPGNRCRDQRV